MYFFLCSKAISKRMTDGNMNKAIMNGKAEKIIIPTKLPDSTEEYAVTME